MLNDRTYMRSEYRPPWSMTKILLLSLVICFIVQWIAQGLWGPFFVDKWFALSKEGILTGKVYQLLTFQFMHAGLWHLLGNMIGLYFFGRAVEDILGKWATLRLYLLSGTIGGLIQVALALAFPKYFAAGVVGASAGVFGLVAAFATRSPDMPITMLIFFVFPVTFPAKVILYFEGLTAILGILAPWLHLAMGNVAHAAHLGGMITGILYMRLQGHFPKPFEFWKPFAKKPAPAPRELVGTAPRRAWRKNQLQPPDPELPPAEFISREVDPILEKISAQGIHSLTDRERQILEAARTKMAKR